MIVDILSDGLFAAIAAIGFGAISDPPLRAFPSIALLAAVGHALRFCLMTYAGIDIATASLCASFTIGMGSLVLGKRILCPMYAYKTVFALILFMQNLDAPDVLQGYIRDIFTNGLVTCSVIFMLAVGATFPLFLFIKRAFSMTRRGK